MKQRSSKTQQDVSKDAKKEEQKDDQKGYTADTDDVQPAPAISDRACCGCCPAYVSAKDIENMKKHKYASQDNSIMNVYLMIPLAKLLVQWIPSWIAPNLITFAGFFMSFGPTFYLFKFYGTSFANDPKRPIPWQWYICQAICYFFSRLFDEMDGQQARTTGNTSPLGQLLDHGCDSMVVTMELLKMAKTMQMGDCALTYGYVMIGSFNFYQYMIEEYYTGFLNLEPGNGATDGAVIVYTFYIISAIYQNEIFAQDFMWGLNYGQGVCTFLIIVLFFICNFFMILSFKRLAARESVPHDQMIGAPISVTGIVMQYLQIVLVLGCGFFYMSGRDVPLVQTVKASQIYAAKTQQYFLNPLFCIIVMVSLVCQNLSQTLMLTHASKRLDKPFTNKILWFFLLSSGAYQYLNHRMAAFKPTRNMGYVMELHFYQTVIMTVVAISQFHFCYYASKQISKGLGISVLRVKKVKKNN